MTLTIVRPIYSMRHHEAEPHKGGFHASAVQRLGRGGLPLTETRSTCASHGQQIGELYEHGLKFCRKIATVDPSIILVPHCRPAYGSASQRRNLLWASAHGQVVRLRFGRWDVGIRTPCAKSPLGEKGRLPRQTRPSLLRRIAALHTGLPRKDGTSYGPARTGKCRLLHHSPGSFFAMTASGRSAYARHREEHRCSDATWRSLVSNAFLFHCPQIFLTNAQPPSIICSEI